jgi:5-methylcytosine-specific restriction endonuclease McrA
VAKEMKHRRTKATDITKQVRMAVSLRDKGQCIICKRFVPTACSNAHYIKRSQGGLGIEENVVTLCPECHFEEDHGQNTKVYEEYIENYLKGIYGAEWNKEKLIYRKW